MRRLLLAAVALTVLAAAATAPVAAHAAACPHWGRPAVAADPRPHALRVFAIQFEQHPAQIATAAEYRRAVDCALRTEVLPHLASGRPNLVVFDEDIGLETIAVGPRGAAARSLLQHGNGCSGDLCLTLATLGDINTGYGRASPTSSNGSRNWRASSAAASSPPPTLSRACS